MLDTPLAQVPTLSLNRQAGDPQGFADALGRSFRRFGFAIVADHGIPDALVARAWDQTKALFELPEEEKRRHHVPGGGGARGYTPFKTEIAKGATHVDLKEFWHVGRDLPAGSPLAASMPPNIWR